MKTVAARAVNELYRHHALQIVITYHAGMQAIGYNWGSFNYYHGVYASPDDNSMHDVAAQLSRFAGTGNVELGVTVLEVKTQLIGNSEKQS